jgi:uncharacterized membrane protein
MRTGEIVEFSDNNNVVTINGKRYYSSGSFNVIFIMGILVGILTTIVAVLLFF